MVKIALSFDDGRKDNLRVVHEILTPLQIPATINITTEYVECFGCEDTPCSNPPMTKNEVIKLARLPIIEIAGHGKRHHNELENLLEGVKELRQWCNMKKIGIASPCSKLSFEEISQFKKCFLENEIGYIRLGDRINHFTLIKKCIRKINQYLHSPSVFGWIYKDTLLGKEDIFVLFSVPVLKRTSLNEVKYLVEKAVDKDQPLILMFHSILKQKEDFYDDTWTWDYDDFYKLCRYLKEMEILGKIRLSKTIDFINHAR